MERPEARYYALSGRRAVVSPGPVGAHNWHAMSYHPKTRLVYIPATDMPTPMEVTDLGSGLVGGSVHTEYSAATRDPKMKGKLGRLLGWDPIAQKARWSVNLDLPTNGGVLSTAGNLVFEGTATGEFRAYRADDGKLLWSVSTGSAIQAAPTTVEVDGEQIVLVPVGAAAALAKMLPSFTISPTSLGPARLLAFKLGGKVPMPQSTFRPIFPKPPLPRFPAKQAERGSLLWEAKGCDLCHGENAVLLLGSPPDLRRASGGVHEEFRTTVTAGRISKGMPAFGEVPESDLEALQALVINQAWEAYEAQEAERGKP
jgi:quinohemoprotein ethanol dehydrogenase